MSRPIECSSGKVRYATELDAGVVLDYLRGVPNLGRTPRKAKPRKRMGVKSAYFCPHCGGWHLTSLSQRSARAQRAKAAAERGYQPWTDETKETT